jgi:hypothetical protein
MATKRAYGCRMTSGSRLRDTAGRARWADGVTVRPAREPEQFVVECPPSGVGHAL